MEWLEVRYEEMTNYLRIICLLQDKLKQKYLHHYPEIIGKLWHYYLLITFDGDRKHVINALWKFHIISEE